MKKYLTCLFLTSIFFAAGCASRPIVEPTYEELQAVKAYKKTVAILDFDDRGSALRGVSGIAAARLDKLLVRHFNLVERRQLDAIMSEQELALSQAADQRMVRIGQLSGADYVITGNVVSTLNGPYTQSSGGVDKKGNFSGYIQDEMRAEAEVFLRVIDTSTSEIYFAGSHKGFTNVFENYRYYEDESAYKTGLAVQAVTKFFSSYDELSQQYGNLIASVITGALDQFDKDFRRKFAHVGQVLEIVSPTDVLINLGSAYGIAPGQQLIVWQEDSAITDPKTGMTIVPKKKKAVLKVIEVNSGLSCLARAGKGLVAKIKVGDKAATY